MADLEQFSRAIESRLAQTRREPDWEVAEVARFMAQFEPRRRAFEEIAPRLVQTIIRPRIEALASYFPNAALDASKRLDRCACWFGYCERFPAETKVEIAVEHDERIESLVLHYQLSIIPVFIKFDADDKLTVPLASDGPDQSAIAAWVEARLLGFLDTYLRLDRGTDDFEDLAAVDPVCGMRIRCSAAGAKMDYRGHPYYFCTDECRRRFAEEPLRYVRFELE
jgi:YHS domain-containing protein